MCIITEKKEKGKKHWVSFFFVYNQYEFTLHNKIMFYVKKIVYFKYFQCVNWKVKK